MPHTLLLRVVVPDERIKGISEATKVPREFLVPNRLTVEWGYRDPDNRRQPQPLGYTTWHMVPGEAEVIPDNLPQSVAAEVVKLLDARVQ